MFQSVTMQIGVPRNDNLPLLVYGRETYNFGDQSPLESLGVVGKGSGIVNDSTEHGDFLASRLQDALETQGGHLLHAGELFICLEVITTARESRELRKLVRGAAVRKTAPDGAGVGDGTSDDGVLAVGVDVGSDQSGPFFAVISK